MGIFKSILLYSQKSVTFKNFYITLKTYRLARSTFSQIIHILIMGGISYESFISARIYIKKRELLITINLLIFCHIINEALVKCFTAL